MKFILKILAFTALLLISKLTKEDELTTTPAETPQVIVRTAQNMLPVQLPVHKTTGNHPGEAVQNFVLKPATIE